MKTTLPSLSLVIVCLAAALCVALPVHAQISPVAIEIEVVKKPFKPPHPGDNATVTDDRHLVITIKNITTGHTLPDLTVKYWLAIRDITTKEITLGVADSTPLSITAFGQQVVTTVDVESKYQTAHRDGLKAIPEAGTKFYGYGIQVLQGGKVVKDVYEPTEIKDVVTGTPDKPN